MPDIISTNTAFTFAKNLLPRLFKALTGISATRKKEIDSIADIFGDPAELATYYVEPDCQQFNPADDNDEARYVVREPIFTRLQHFFSGPCITGAGENQLLILADSGMGKTSVLLMLKLAHINSFWPKGYECVLLKIGVDTLEKIQAITSHRNKILLLDALDEDPMAWGNVESRLTTLLAATKTFRRVVITCRTQFFSAGEDPFNRRGQVSVRGFICPVIYLSLFNEIQIEKYCKKRFPKSKEMMQKAKKILGKMRSLRFRPMLLVHIEDIIQSEKEKWTEYSIYDALITAWLQREHRKMLGRITKIPDINELRYACRSYALKLHLSGKKSLDPIEFNNFLLFNKDLNHLKTMDIGGRSLLNKNSKGEFRFSHYSVQEFLVTEALVYGQAGQNIGSIRPTDQIIMFLLSLLETQTPEKRKHISLRVLDFSGLSLRNRNLSWIGIQGATLERVDLEASELIGADARSANFKEANLRRVNLEGANLERACLDGADLTGANLKRANLRYANLEKANIEKANLSEAILEGATMNDAKICGGNLYKANLHSANLEGADLSECNLGMADLSKTNISMTKFTKAIIKMTIFKDATPKIRAENLEKRSKEDLITPN